MKKLPTIVFIIPFVLLILSIQSALSETKDMQTIVVTARLTEIPGKFAPNDLYNYVYIMKYRILKVIKGRYKEKEILVGHYNPLMPRKSVKDAMASHVKGDVEKFEVGSKHTLTLVAPIDKIWNDAIEDEYFDSELTKYFAISADQLK